MRKWIVVLLLLAAPGVTQEGPDRIELGANLAIGMPKAQALAEVEKHYSTKPMQDDPSEYIVFDRPAAAGEKPVWEGILTFKAGKLVGVERLWAYDDDEKSVALTKSLFGALTSVVKSGKSTCVVEDEISDTADAQGETVYLNCGKRSIKISVAKVQGYKEDASISEILGQ